MKRRGFMAHRIVVLFGAIYLMANAVFAAYVSDWHSVLGWFTAYWFAITFEHAESKNRVASTEGLLRDDRASRTEFYGRLLSRKGCKSL